MQDIRTDGVLCAKNSIDRTEMQDRKTKTEQKNKNGTEK